MKKLLISILFCFPFFLKAQSFFMLSYPKISANDTINVQLWDSARNQGKFSNSAWNNWAPVQGVSGSLTSAVLKYSTGVTSTTHILVNVLNDYSANGSSYGTSNTMGYPGGVFVEASYNTAAQTFTFSNVPSGTSYRIEIVSSAGLGSGPYNVTFTSGSASQSVNAFSNLSTLVVLDNLSASAGNVAVTTTATNGFSILCAIRLIIKH